MKHLRLLFCAIFLVTFARGIFAQDVKVSGRFVTCHGSKILIDEDSPNKLVEFEGGFLFFTPDDIFRKQRGKILPHGFI